MTTTIEWYHINAHFWCISRQLILLTPQINTGQKATLLLNLRHHYIATALDYVTTLVDRRCLYSLLSERQRAVHSELEYCRRGHRTRLHFKQAMWCSHRSRVVFSGHTAISLRHSSLIRLCHCQRPQTVSAITSEWSLPGSTTTSASPLYRLMIMRHQLARLVAHFTTVLVLLHGHRRHYVSSSNPTLLPPYDSLTTTTQRSGMSQRMIKKRVQWLWHGPQCRHCYVSLLGVLQEPSYIFSGSSMPL